MLKVQSLLILMVIFFNVTTYSSWQTQIQLKSTIYNDKPPDVSLAGFIGKQVEFDIGQNHQLDFETIRKINIPSFTSSSWTIKDITIKNYRSVVRYQNGQYEGRVGIQQLNFGQAKFLRPLQWFDTIDPMDPSIPNKGVYGLLNRYTFFDNKAVWLWGLFGNHDRRISDFYATKENALEWGGRFEWPVQYGEFGLSFHQRKVDVNDASGTENRIGLDMLFDFMIPIWTETVYVRSDKSSGNYSMMSSVVGSDYTLDIGNGVYIMSELMLKSSELNAIKSKKWFLTSQVSYPLSMINQVGFISMIDDQNLSEQIISFETKMELYKMTLLIYKKMIKLSLMINF